MASDNCDNSILGNTNTKIEKQKRVQCRKWCGTWNNYEENDIEILKKFFEDNKYQYIIGKEIGEQGTPHLQFFFENKNNIDFNKIKKAIPKCHVEKCKGTTEDNVKYCSKDKNFITNIKMTTFKQTLEIQILMQYEKTIWKPWQQEIIELLKTKPDNRTVNWYWESNGNAGKSYLAKYIALTYPTIIAEGKKSDVFNQLNKMLTEEEKEPHCVILDIPRFNKDFTNYSVLEQLKNGMAYSGKYEGGRCIFNPPHVIVFANQLPDESQFSKDRWNIKMIE